MATVALVEFIRAFSAWCAPDEHLGTVSSSHAIITLLGACELPPTLRIFRPMAAVVALWQHA